MIYIYRYRWNRYRLNIYDRQVPSKTLTPGAGGWSRITVSMVIVGKTATFPESLTCP